MNIANTFFMGLALTALVSCGNAGNTESQDAAEATTETTTEGTTTEANGGGKVEFAETAIDFGKVKEGEIVERVFTYTNTGTEPVILSQVSASCGCTTPSYTQTPVLPGEKGEVKVSFDSKGQTGKQQKIITVVSNAENRVTTVQLKGEVEPK